MKQGKLFEETVKRNKDGEIIDRQYDYSMSRHTECHSQRDASSTSFKAGDIARKSATAWRKVAHQAIRDFPASTARELARDAGVDYDNIGKRLSELRDGKNLITNIDPETGRLGERKCTVKGTKMMLWWDCS